MPRSRRARVREFQQALRRAVGAQFAGRTVDQALREELRDFLVGWMLARPLDPSIELEVNQVDERNGQLVVSLRLVDPRTRGRTRPGD